MNKKDILNEMGGISPEFIEEANAPARRKMPITRIVAVAASFAILIGACLAIPFMTNTDLPFEETVPEQTTAVGHPGEISYIPKWDEMDDGKRYTNLEDDGPFGHYYSSRTPVDSSFVGEYLSDTVASGYDVYEEATHKTGTMIYKLKNVDIDTAICVKFESSADYYLFKNPNIHVSTLGDFAEKFGLSDYLSFTGYAERRGYFRDSIIYVLQYGRRIYNLTETKGLYDLLFEKAETPLAELPPFGTTEGPIGSVSFAVDCLTTGQKNVDITVYEHGYLTTNINWYGYCFFIGEEQAAKIIDYMERNSVLVKEDIPVNEPPVTSSDGTVHTSPPYDPNKPHTSPSATSALAYTTARDTEKHTTHIAFTTRAEETKRAFTVKDVSQWETTSQMAISDPIPTETTCETAKEYPPK